MEAQRRRQRKKLIEAARHWAGIRGTVVGAFAPDHSVLDAMQAWGAPQDEIDKVRAQLDAAAPPPDEEPFGVHADNWPTVMAFCTLGPRWQYAGIPGQRTGLDWAGVEAWIDRHVVRRRQRRGLSSGLQTMERAALVADRELRAADE